MTQGHQARVIIAETLRQPEACPLHLCAQNIPIFPHFWFNIFPGVRTKTPRVGMYVVPLTNYLPDTSQIFSMLRKN